MKKGPFKMKGMSFKSESPVKDVETEYIEGGMVKTDTKKGSSSKWSLIDTKKRKDGTTVYTYKNDDTGATKTEMGSAL